MSERAHETTSAGASSSADLAGDYEALTTGVGVVSMERDVVEVVGPDALSYLQGQLSQEVATLAVGSSTLSLVLEPQGKLDALVRVTRTAEDRFVMDVDKGHGEDLLARLQRFKLRTKAEMRILEGWECVALRGPGSGAVIEALGAPDDVLVASFDWPGASGFDLLGPAVEAPAGVRLCGSAAWEAVRIEAGLPAMGIELSEKTIPAEAGLVAHTVSFTKGCYTGQELVARIDSRGEKVPRKLRGLTADRVLAPGTSLVIPAQDGVAEREVGIVTSSAYSPRLGPVALAYLRREVEPPATVTAVAGDDRVEVRVEVSVSALPLVAAH